MNKDNIYLVCGANDVLEIIYGVQIEEGIKDYEKGNIEFGGCIFEGDEPNRKCKNCGAIWEERELTFKEKVYLYKGERKECKGII